MREGKEKIIKKGGEPTIKEQLVILKNTQMKAIKEDQLLHERSWEHINPELLIKECLELFELYSKGTLESLSNAKDKLSVVEEMIKDIKSKEEKSSNLDFFHWIDDKIRKAHQIELEKQESGKM